MTIYDASVRYEAEGTPLIVIAGKEYGSGSSRDWAAKGPKLLGVRAVIAESYERIHRSNLLMMGILPLQFMDGESPETLGLTGREEFSVEGASRTARPARSPCGPTTRSSRRACGSTPHASASTSVTEDPPLCAAAAREPLDLLVPEDRRDAADRVEVGCWRSASTWPPWASTWWTARSRPSSRCSISVPSSGQRPPLTLTRPHAGHWHAERSTPSWNTRHSTRPSDAASSVSSHPDAARPPRPASSFQRSTSSDSRRRCHFSSTGCETSYSSVGEACDSAVVQPTIAFRASAARTLELALQLLRADDDHSRELEPAQLPLQLCGDRLQVVLRELVDVALVPRLRPAALVVLARLFLREVGDLLEPPGAQPVEAQLAADVRHDRTLSAADERDERRGRGRARP